MRRLILPALGLALLVAGVVLVVTTSVDLDHAGFIAYAPPRGDYAGAFEVSGARLVSDGQLLGGVATALGLAALTAYAGFRLGRRSRG